MKKIIWTVDPYANNKALDQHIIKFIQTLEKDRLVEGLREKAGKGG